MKRKELVEALPEIVVDETLTLNVTVPLIGFPHIVPDPVVTETESTFVETLYEALPDSPTVSLNGSPTFSVDCIDAFTAEDEAVKL
ncbi:MAG: hypothetical protein C4317_08345, partial [Acidimicrobiia bacterium]